MRLGENLFKRAEKFQPKQTHFTSGILAQDFGYDRWCLARDEARRGRRWGGDGEMYCLIWPENVSRGDTGTSRADVESFGEFDELGARHIGASQEDWHLQANAR